MDTNANVNLNAPEIHGGGSQVAYLCNGINPFHYEAKFGVMGPAGPAGAVEFSYDANLSRVLATESFQELTF
jgi:hypothetical protein